MHHLLEHINQVIERRKSKDKDSTVHKTEYWSKRNPTGKQRWVLFKVDRVESNFISVHSMFILNSLHAGP